MTDFLVIWHNQLFTELRYLRIVKNSTPYNTALRPVLYLKNLEIYSSRDLQNLQTVPPKLRQ